MARRRRKRRRGSKSKAIPVLPTVAAIYPAYKAYNAVGLTKTLPAAIMQQYTGYYPETGDFNSSFPLRTGGMFIAGYIGHKVASKTGVNRWIKKATMGFLTL